MPVELRLISSLEKVFWDEELRAPLCAGITALRGERVSFQAACRLTDEEWADIAARVEAPLPAEIYEVGVVPVTLPAYSLRDKAYLRTTPGLYPDPLYPHRGELSLVQGQWRSLWVSLTVPQDMPAGVVSLRLVLSRAGRPGEKLAEADFRVEVIPASLPEQTLLHTEWFHCDCLATRYRVPVFSEAHWSLIDSYMENAAAYGINMILTPLFTPPLDTAVGEERPTVQLVEVRRQGSGYIFGFERLERYMALAEKHGIRRFEMAHLFTQWGAAAAPKIMAEIDGEERRIFGWDTDAGSVEYVAFLRAFLRALRGYLDGTGRSDRCWFHISDEPSLDMLEAYRRAKESIAEELEGFPIIDALSSYAFYEKGVVARPIPSNDHIEEFLAHGVKPLWTYTCCAQKVDVSNRFMAMPSARNRVLGCQLFKYDIEGFLQWGYNFWYSRESRREIDPFIETGGGDAFPAGDAFLVYPGPDGRPIPSLRQLVFHEGLQDLRALRLLETLTSHEEAVALLEEAGRVGFRDYPRSAAWLLAMRERVNRRIAELI